MYKKIFQILIITACVVLIAYVYYQFSKGEDKLSNPYQVIPSNASFVMEVKSGNNTSNYRQWLNSLIDNPRTSSDINFHPISQWTPIMAKLDSLRKFDTHWGSVLMQQSAVFASTSTMRNDMWLVSIGLSESQSSSTKSSLIKSWNTCTTSREYKGVTIHECSPWVYGVINNCFIIASNNAVIEDVIIRSGKNDLLQIQPHFEEVYTHRSTDSPIHFFFSMNEGEWLQLDPTKVGDAFTLSGYAAINEPTKNTIRLVASGNGFQIAHYLPSNTSILDVYSYPDFETGWRIQEEYFKSSDASKFWSQAWKDYGDTCSCDLNELLLAWRDAEWGSAVIPTSDSSSATMMFIQVKDSISVASKMQSLIRKTSSDSLVYHVIYPHLFDRNKPQSFLVECNYMTQVGNFVFLSASSTALSSLHRAAFKPLFAHDEYQQYQSIINQKSGRLTYQTAYYISPLPQGLLALLEGHSSLLVQTEQLPNNKYLVTIGLPSSLALKSDVIQSTETPTATASQTNLKEINRWSVLNHNNQQNETLLQLEDNTLQLIGTDGKTLWSRKLEAPILGDIAQIDALRNNKLQYAFTTTKNLCIIDRNGNNLKGFPITSQSPITTPIHIADYGGDKKYRLLYGSEDGTIHNKTVEAITPTGWRSPKSQSTFVTSFRIQGEDYIAAVSATGSIFLFKRNGELRKEYPNHLPNYNGGKIAITPSEKLEGSTVTYTTNTGSVTSINL